MIKLIPVTEDNWMDIASLTVKEYQRNYVAPSIGILARGYVYRDCNAKIYESYAPRVGEYLKP